MKSLKEMLNESKANVEFSLSTDDIEFLKGCFDKYGYVNLALDLNNGECEGIEVNINGKWQKLK